MFLSGVIRKMVDHSLRVRKLGLVQGEKNEYYFGHVEF